MIRTYVFRFAATLAYWVLLMLGGAVGYRLIEGWSLHDSIYLAVMLSARSLSSELVIVARAVEEESSDKLFRAGANHVVSPNLSGALRMASYLLRLSVVSFLDVALRSPEGPPQVERLKSYASSA